LPICFQRFILLQAKRKLALITLWFNFDSNCASKALKQNLRQTNRIGMKTLIKSAVIGLALATAAQAVASLNVTQNATQNVTISPTSFTFNQFNSSLGTLTAVDLILNSSVPGGAITASDQTGGNMQLIDFDSRFRLPQNLTLGISAHAGSFTSINTSPDWASTIIPSNSSQVFTILGGQSLISSPVTQSISNAKFNEYTGSGTVTVSSFITNAITATAATFSVDSTNYFSATSMTLRYTYTASPSPVPEPGQVAASLLLLGGIGGYIFIKRRRVATNASA
jgi:hypothetical protein